MNVFETLQALDDTTIHTAIVYSESLECNIRVVLMPINTGKTGYKIFFSTDTEMHAANLLQYYKSCFQPGRRAIEFLYRDANRIAEATAYGVKRLPGAKREKATFSN